MSRKLFIVIVILLAGIKLSAQTAPQNSKSNLEGTYQLIFKSKQEVTDYELNDSQKLLINDLRSQNDVVFYNVSEHLKIKILPFSEINKPGFIKVETVAYENETILTTETKFKTLSN